MDCIAHRGFAATNPENTLQAVRAAATAGADLVEVDVRRCGSGELVVVHDATVDRVSDGTGRVADTPLAALQQLDVLGTGAGVPTLSAVFEAAGDTRLNVELKETGTAADAVALARDHGRDPLVASFDPALLARVARSSDFDTALICADAPEASLTRARNLDCAALHPHEEFCVPAFVERVHEADMAVNAWTVRDGETADRLVGAGVDGLIADAPDCCR